MNFVKKFLKENTKSEKLKLVQKLAEIIFYDNLKESKIIINFCLKNIHMIDDNDNIIYLDFLIILLNIDD